MEKWVIEHEEDAFQQTCEAWTTIIDAFGEHWAPVVTGLHGAPGVLRDRFVFPHGLGWTALTLAVAELRAEAGPTWADRFRTAVRAIDWDRRNPEWEGRATIQGTVTNTAQNVRATTQYILSAARSEVG